MSGPPAGAVVVRRRLDGRVGRRSGRPGRGCRQRADDRQRRRDAARLPRHVRRVRRVAPRRRARAGALACRRCERSFFLPRAGRSMDDEGLQLEPVPLLRSAAGQGGACGMNANGGRAPADRRRARRSEARGDRLRPARRWRGRRRSRAAPNGRCSAPDVEPCDLCGIDDPRGPPPPAPPRGAADRVLVRGLLGDARRRGRLPSDRQPDAVALGAGSSRTTSGRASRSRSGSRSSCESTVTECVVAMYPSPAGATESELHFESWSRMLELNPVLARTGARHRGADRQPPGRSGDVRDRADRPLLRADRTDQGELGGNLRRAGVEQAVAGFFESCARRGGSGVSLSGPCRVDAQQPGRSVPEPEFAVLGARPVAPRGRADADARPPGQRAERASDLHDRTEHPADDRARAAGLRRRDPRAAGRAVRFARSGGR